MVFPAPPVYIGIEEELEPEGIIPLVGIIAPVGIAPEGIDKEPEGIRPLEDKGLDGLDMDMPPLPPALPVQLGVPTIGPT